MLNFSSHPNQHYVYIHLISQVTGKKKSSWDRSLENVCSSNSLKSKYVERFVPLTWRKIRLLLQKILGFSDTSHTETALLVYMMFKNGCRTQNVQTTINCQVTAGICSFGEGNRAMDVTVADLLMVAFSESMGSV